MRLIKNTVLLLGTSFVLFGFSNCGASKNEKLKYELTQDAPFTIANSFYQDWVAGVKDGGAGTNLHITFGSLPNTISIESFYFQQQLEPAVRSTQNKLLYIGYFSEEKKQDIIMDANVVEEAKNTPPKSFPFQLAENEAVIAYKDDGKLSFFKLSNIEQKPMLAYPQSNPNGEQ
ncbi:hypothetical protein [Candidatus Ulvibacter alkanivorans]|uniref:hypothetical protein n=1 Tax=Candidatus Ulvibacter alkanivorans TaxID=2267620 RepID=UPI00109C964A|nr:hypothetical protein [Candidatus Ulvibacter alkanivorans]